MLKIIKESVKEIYKDKYYEPSYYVHKWQMSVLESAILYWYFLIYGAGVIATKIFAFVFLPIWILPYLVYKYLTDKE